MTKEIPLTQGMVALVDDEDYEYLNRFKWSMHIRGYAQGRVNGKYCLMHRVVLSPTDGLQVDHINGNKLDNRRCNLRLASDSQNHANSKKRKGSLSRFKGVTWFRWYQKWRAAIVVNRKQKHLGYFENEEDAARAYDRAALENFGEFAKTNF